MDRAAKAYFSEGLLLLMLTLLLFCASAIAVDSDGSHIGTSHLVRFLPFLPVLLTYAALAVTLGLVQAHIRWSNRVKRISALVYAGSVLIYGYAGYWVIWQLGISGPLVPWRFAAVLGAGLLLMLTVVANGWGILSTAADGVSEWGGPPVTRRWNMVSLKVYLVGGLALILLPLFWMWYAGLLVWRNAGAGRDFDWVYGGIAAHTICVTLGVLAVVLGLLQSRVHMTMWAQLIVSVAYVTGAALFSGGLYRASWIGTGMVLNLFTTAGLILLLGTTLANLWGVVASRAEA